MADDSPRTFRGYSAALDAFLDAYRHYLEEVDPHARSEARALVVKTIPAADEALRDDALVSFRDLRATGLRSHKEQRRQDG